MRQNIIENNKKNNKPMKRVLYLIFALFVVVAFMPSCEVEPNAPESNKEPIKPNTGGGGETGGGETGGGEEPDTPSHNENLVVDS